MSFLPGNKGKGEDEKLYKPINNLPSYNGSIQNPPITNIP